EKGGLEAGDVIKRFNGSEIETSSDLPIVVGSTSPNQSVRVEILRKGGKKTLMVKVGEMPTDEILVSKNAQEPKESVSNQIGLTLSNLTPQQKSKLKGKNGLLVIASTGAAAEAGVRRGDVILGLNNSETQSVEQFNKQINAVPKEKTIAVLVQRADSTLYVPIKVK
ncbi:MAG: PDZ domain-containing protein, partial [Methylophilaceae bacterium]|nr:PDZ domain-containing protein [Methylophilaceae bacterium]